MTPKKSVLNKLVLLFKMATLSIASLLSYFSDEKKSIKKGENHCKSDHVESFSYHEGVLRGEVHASMKKKVYKVTVSYSFESCWLRSSTCIYHRLTFVYITTANV